MRIDLTKTNGSSPPVEPVLTPARSRIQAWFDGAYEPHRGGHAGWGSVVEVSGKVVFSKGGYIGSGPEMSNNVAEYCGCIAVLEQIRTYCSDATVFGDSALVVNQLTCQYRANGGLYLPYFRRADAILDTIGRDRVRFEWIPGASNLRADRLSHQALALLRIKPSKTPKNWTTG
jgi:ribonuclease HI